ncbi:MAG: DUF167 domain-containing protein [Coriobacteriales bacterium]|jgi:uncharacterized protein (TIGR00251 family)|nr:DUF167 domain-containing protein [Coriobacteriales bacterium]
MQAPSVLSLAVKVVPRAGADAVVGWCDDSRAELLIRVSAAPEDGKANAALTKTLARSLGIPKSAITILRGQRSRHKLLSCTVDSAQFEAWRDALPIQR